MDVSLLLGWSSFAAFSLGGTWLPYGTRSGEHHDKSARRPSSFLVTFYFIITYIPFVLALWLFSRSFDPSGALYITAHCFICLALLLEKCWVLMHWERRRMGWAAVYALLSAVSFALSSVFVGLVGGGNRWEHVPLLVTLCGAALWYVWIAVEDAQ